MEKNLTIAIPALNEGKTIGNVIETVLKLERVGEIILVDDGSIDNTFEIMDSFKSRDPRVKVIRNEINRGKGFSLREAINHTTKEYFIVQDADLELDPNSIESLFVKLNESGADMVNGSRDLDIPNVSRISKLAGLFLPMFVFILFGKWIEDVVCGYKLMTTENYKKLNLNSDRFEIETEIVVKAIRNKYKIAEQKVVFKPRSISEGKHPRWTDGLKIFKLLFKYRLGKK